MSRSAKKGPFIDAHLMKKIEGMNQINEKKVLRTWSRRSTIHPDFVRHVRVLGLAGLFDLYGSVATCRSALVEIGRDRPRDQSAPEFVALRGRILALLDEETTTPPDALDTL